VQSDSEGSVVGLRAVFHAIRLWLPTLHGRARRHHHHREREAYPLVYLPPHLRQRARPAEDPAATPSAANPAAPAEPTPPVGEPPGGADPNRQS
jgi:hypothetical protein